VWYTNCEATRYVIFSILLLLPPSAVSDTVSQNSSSEVTGDQGKTRGACSCEYEKHNAFSSVEKYNGSFGGKCCFRVQGKIIRPRMQLILLPVFTPISILASSMLKIQGTCSSETSIDFSTDLNALCPRIRSPSFTFVQK
jgi:hypothetical protein